MSQEIEAAPSQEQACPGWGLLGTVALIGLAAAALIVVSRTRRGVSKGSVDDLISAADRVADNLERSLIGEKARAS